MSRYAVPTMNKCFMVVCGWSLDNALLQYIVRRNVKVSLSLSYSVFLSVYSTVDFVYRL